MINFMSTSVKITLDTRREKKDKTYPIILRLSHNRKTIPISLGYSVPEKYWDVSDGKVKKSYTGISNVTRLNNLLQKRKANALDVITQLLDSKEIDKLSVKELKERIINKSSKYTFYKYATAVIAELIKSGRHGYARSMNDMLASVKNANDETDFSFEQLNYNFIKKFESYHRSRGNSINSIGVYLRNIRAVFNRAIKEGHAKPEWYPFRDYSIKREKTKKRAVSMDVITKIRNLDLPVGQRIWHARNYFLFSFYAMGINFIDIARLRPSNIVNGRLEYKRNKTNKSFSIKLTEHIKQILDDYLSGNKDDGYIFPIIKRKENQELEYSDIINNRKVYNSMLKKISEKCELGINLTSYVSRHSWATIGKKGGVPIAVISEGLGHSDLSVTETYLDSFDKEVLDDYNEMITN